MQRLKCDNKTKGMVVKSTIVEKKLGKITKFYFELTFLPSSASMLSLKSESLRVSWILGNPTLNRGVRWEWKTTNKGLNIPK